MSRFDWKGAVVAIAQGLELGHRMDDLDGMRPLPVTVARREREASYAAWICRSYNRKGVRRAVAA